MLIGNIENDSKSVAISVLCFQGLLIRLPVSMHVLMRGGAERNWSKGKCFVDESMKKDEK